VLVLLSDSFLKDIIKTTHYASKNIAFLVL